MPSTTTSPTSQYRQYADVIRTLDGEAVVAEMFQVVVGGRTSANVVLQALTVAARAYDDDAAQFRAIATAIACDDAQIPFMTLKGAENMAVQFAQQATDARRMLALLNGDDEDEEGTDG